MFFFVWISNGGCLYLWAEGNIKGLLKRLSDGVSEKPRLTVCVFVLPGWCVVGDYGLRKKPSHDFSSQALNKSLCMLFPGHDRDSAARLHLLPCLDVRHV